MSPFKRQNKPNVHLVPISAVQIAFVAFFQPIQRYGHLLTSEMFRYFEYINEHHPPFPSSLPPFPSLDGTFIPRSLQAHVKAPPEIRRAMYLSHSDLLLVVTPWMVNIKLKCSYFVMGINFFERTRLIP